MDSTEETIYKVLELITLKEKEEWLRLKTITQAKSKEKKSNDKAWKKTKAGEFHEKQVQLRQNARKW